MISRRSIRNRLMVFSAALAAGAFAWNLPAMATDPPSAQPAQQPSGNMQGTNGSNNGSHTVADADRTMPTASMQQSVSTADQAGVRDLLASVTDTAISPDASRNITQYFTDASRNRLSGINVDTNPNNNATANKPGNASANAAMANGSAAGGPTGLSDNSRGGAAAAAAAQRDNAKSMIDESDLNAKIDQLKKDWQAKYNKPFDVKEKEVVYNNDSFQILPGDLSDQARTAAEQIPSNATPENPAHQNTDTGNNAVRGAVSGSNMSAGSQAAVANGADRAQNAENPTRNATLHVNASHHLPAIDVPLVRGTTAEQWKIDAPAALTQQQLHDNLLKQVTAIDDAKDHWPSDANDAYRIVSHRVLIAVTNTAEGTGQNP